MYIFKNPEEYKKCFIYYDKHCHCCDCDGVHWSGPRCGDDPAPGTIGYKNGVKCVWVGPEYNEDYGHWERVDGKDIDGWSFAPGV